MLKFAILVVGNPTPLSRIFFNLQVFAKADRRPSVMAWNVISLRQRLSLGRFLSPQQVLSPSHNVLMVMHILQSWAGSAFFPLSSFSLFHIEYVFNSPYKPGLGHS